MNIVRGRFITKHSWIRGDWRDSFSLQRELCLEYTYIKPRFHIEVEFDNGQAALYKFK